MSSVLSKKKACTSMRRAQSPVTRIVGYLQRQVVAGGPHNGAQIHQ